MKSKTVIVSEQHRARAISIITALALDEVHEVVVRPYKRDRSAEQSSMYWMWLTVISNELGETKEALHERYKGRFLVPIYERDNPDYAEMIQSIRAIYSRGMQVEALNLRKRIVELTSTTAANVKQMTEYLHDIEQDATSMAISLPHPDDERG